VPVGRVRAALYTGNRGSQDEARRESSLYVDEYGQSGIDLWEPRLVETGRASRRAVLEIHKAKLGEDHPSTLMSMANLDFTRKSSGHKEAHQAMWPCCFPPKITPANKFEILGSSCKGITMSGVKACQPGKIQWLFRRGDKIVLPESDGIQGGSEL